VSSVVESLPNFRTSREKLTHSSQILLRSPKQSLQATPMKSTFRNTSMNQQLLGASHSSSMPIMYQKTSFVK
jgi:hypothetical protein